MTSIRNPLESAEWQSVQSAQAMINGGALGVGVGNSQAKYPGYLPVSWSDNIFAIIGEELGLVGALFVILLFALLAYRGLRIALERPDNFGMLLATGITTLLILQAVLNTAVVVAVAPPTGVTLPFISYGGSSLVTALGAIGIMLNISRQIRPGVAPPAATGNLAYARFDFGWGNGRPRLSGNRRRRTNRTSTKKSGSSSRRTNRRPARAAAANQVLWVGSVDGMEQELVERAGIVTPAFTPARSGASTPCARLRSGGKMMAGVQRAWPSSVALRRRSAW